MRRVALVQICLSAATLIAGADVARAADRALSYAPAPVLGPIAPIMAGGNSYAAIKRFEPPHGRVCFNSGETRDKISTLRLTEPFRAMQLGRLQGDALRAKLCRWKPDEFIYEIAVLRRDGRVVHVYMNALNGQTVGGESTPGAAAPERR